MSDRKSKILYRMAPVAFLVLAMALFFIFGLDRFFSFETLDRHQQQLVSFVAEYPLAAPIIFIVIYATIVAASLPGAAVLSVGGGFLFGLLAGAAYIVIGATIGACIVFLIARTALGDSLHDRAGPWLDRMERGFKENGVSYLLFLRLVPVFPFWLVNLVPAFLGMSFVSFAAATFFGIIPGAVVYASFGNGLGAILDRGQEPDLSIIFEPQIILPLLALAVLALIPTVYRHFRAASAKSDVRPS